MRRRTLTLLLAAAAATAPAAIAAGAPAAGAATFSPPALVSGGPSQPITGAGDPVASADGRYVAFTGTLAGVPGVYRKDVLTGDLNLVVAGDATAPSISADGRFVSFTTTAQLDQTAVPAGACSSVYVRDMAIPLGTPGAQTLASALNGSALGLTYGDSIAASCAGGGASAAPRVALSADGRRVAFTVIGSSDLMTGAGGGTTTPPDQVVVRDLDTQTTTLVSQTSASLGGAPQPVPGGAALAEPAGTGSSTAAISADGSTVAWMGIDVAAQAPVEAGSPATQTALPEQYDEPLWRRVADGPNAPTRRVTGGDDPVACAGCAGPLVTTYNPQTVQDSDAFPHFGTYVVSSVPTDLGPFVPQLSANGTTVALLSTQPTPATAQGLALASNSSIPSANVYVVNMANGLTRTQALTQLTTWASFNFGSAATTGAVRDVAISPDGTHLAFTTDRILFALPSPTLVSQPLNQAGASQLYDVDLSAGTFQRVSDGFDQQPADGDVTAPAFSGDGKTLVFASAAANLVYGIGAQSTSVFSITDDTTAPVLGHQSVSPAPSVAKPAPARVLGASAKHGAHGTVVVYASVPGPGTVQAAARASVPVTSTVKVRVHGRVVKRRRTALAARTVASGHATAKKAGVVRIVLTAATRWNTLVSSRQGLVATLSVGFSSKGHKRLEKRLQVSFHGKPAKPKRAAKRPVAKKKTTITTRSKSR